MPGDARRRGAVFPWRISVSDGHLRLVIILALLMSLPLNITAANQYGYRVTNPFQFPLFSRPTICYTGFLSWHGALQVPWTCLERCFQNYRENVSHARRGGPWTASRTADANLDFVFVESALLHTRLGKVNRMEVSHWPDLASSQAWKPSRRVRSEPLYRSTSTWAFSKRSYTSWCQIKSRVWQLLWRTVWTPRKLKWQW